MKSIRMPSPFNPTPALKPTINIELTRLLYRHLFTSIPALIVLASIIVWGITRYTTAKSITIWYSVFISAILLRIVLSIWYNHTKLRADLHPLHYRLFVINSCLIAALWGVSDSLLMPHALHSQFLVIIIMAGVTAGAVVSLMPSYLASALYTSFTIVPLIMWLISQGNQSIYIGLTVAITTYWIFLLVVGHRGYLMFVNNIKLRMEKNSLLENLSVTNQKLSLSIDHLLLINSALHDSEERFHQSFDFAAIGMALISLKGHWLKVNQALCNLVGYSEKEMLQLDDQSITYQDDLSTDAHYFQQMLSGQLHTYQIEKRYRCKDGTIIWTLHNRVLVRDAENRPLYFILQIQNIDMQKRAEKELRYIAYHDTLTQLDNRKMLEIKFQQAQGYALRNKHNLAVLFIDIDYFKNVNDSLGHDAGDLLLKTLAQRLQNFKRKTDILVRLSGDEFVLILTEVNEPEEIAPRVRDLQQIISADFILNHHAMHMTTSIGISLYPQDGQDLQTLLKKADLALYKVKKAGRNNFQFYAIDIDEKV